MIRMFKSAKDSAIKARTQAINQLKAVLIRAEPHLRDSLTGLSLVALIRACAELEPAGRHDIHDAATSVLRTLARRVQTITQEIHSHQASLTEIITTRAPKLLERRGIGPDTAARLLLTAGDNPDRLTSEAAFAALCGANPIQASSGKTTRHRLNRGGDRRSNSALYTIVLTRLGRNQRTREYAERRTTEANPRRKSSAASSATSFARSTRSSSKLSHQHKHPLLTLDKHRGVITIGPLHMASSLDPLGRGETITTIRISTFNVENLDETAAGARPSWPNESP
jgi:transposase